MFVKRFMATDVIEKKNAHIGRPVDDAEQDRQRVVTASAGTGWALAAKNLPLRCIVQRCWKGNKKLQKYADGP